MRKEPVRRSEQVSGLRAEALYKNGYGQCQCQSEYDGLCHIDSGGLGIVLGQMDGRDDGAADAEHQSDGGHQEPERREYIDGCQCVTSYAVSDEDTVNYCHQGDAEHSQKCRRKHSAEELRNVVRAEIDRVSLHSCLVQRPRRYENNDCFYVSLSDIKYFRYA